MADVQQQIVAGFQACARDRAATQDPTEVPASCQQTQPVALSPDTAQRVQQVIAAPPTTPAKSFTRATQQTLWFNAGVFPGRLLSLLLPATPRSRQPQPDQQPTTVTADPRAARHQRDAPAGPGTHSMATNRARDDGDRRRAAPPHTELPQVGAAPARQPVQPTVGEPTPMVNGDKIRRSRYARGRLRPALAGMTVPALYTGMAEEFALVRSGAYTAWVASAEKASR